MSTSDPILSRLPAVPGGRRLGPCILTDLIGRGATPRVYRWRHGGADGRTVAVKCLWRSCVEGDARSLARFRREAAIARSIRHDHLVGVLDSGETEGSTTSCWGTSWRRSRTTA